jgi:hypothetical protein
MYSVVPVTSSLLTTKLYFSVITTLVYEDKIFDSLHDVATKLHCILIALGNHFITLPVQLGTLLLTIKDLNLCRLTPHICVCVCVCVCVSAVVV